MMTCVCKELCGQVACQWATMDLLHLGSSPAWHCRLAATAQCATAGMLHVVNMARLVG